MGGSQRGKYWIQSRSQEQAFSSSALTNVGDVASLLAWLPTQVRSNTKPRKVEQYPTATFTNTKEVVEPEQRQIGNEGG